jgi:CheY-like chemotaxis protein
MTKPALNLQSLRFLVADGNSYFQGVLHGILHAIGAQHIAVAGNGDDALARSRAEVTDLLICDWNLPQLDGFALVKRIREDNHNPNRHTPVIVLTGHAQARNVQRARDCGANLVLAKPISPKMIYDRLLWIAEDPRSFVLSSGYIGPDRRFKEGPPLGEAERRGTGQAASTAQARLHAAIPACVPVQAH